MADSYDSHIGLRQLRYFVAVAEELHFGRAAERLHMSQPPLTQQIQKLERELGTPVFIRASRRTVLTDAGSVLLEEARRVLREFDRAIDRARRAAHGETGRLILGTPPSVMLTRLPAVIRKYCERFPEVSFALREMSTSAIAAGLDNGSLDAGLLREVPTGAQLLFREPLVAVLPVAHPLAARPRLHVRHLAAEPFILFPRRVGEAFYDRLTSFCAAAGFTPRVVQEATQWQSVVTFVETGLGVSLAPACVRKFRWSGVTYRPLAGLSTSVYVRANQSPAAAAFLKLLRAELAP